MTTVMGRDSRDKSERLSLLARIRRWLSRVG